MSYKRKYSAKTTTRFTSPSEDRPKWFITCADCGVFVISVWRVKIAHKFVIRCVECNTKLTTELEDFRGTKIKRVIDSQGKDISSHKKPELSETSTV